MTLFTRGGPRSFGLLLSTGVALWALGGCAASRLPPPHAPALATPGDAVPPDLDLVIRVDLAKVRAALGPEGLAALRREASSAVAAETESQLVMQALERTDVVCLALRPELIPGEADNVLVLSGHFAGLDVERSLRRAGWSAPIDLGGAVWRYDRSGRASRSAPVRAYVFGDDGLVFVSAAEIDSMEQVLEHGMAPNPMKPKARGVLAFAARFRVLRGGLSARYPFLAGTIGDAAGVEGSVDSTEAGLGLEIALELPSDERATSALADLERVQQVLGATDGKLATMAHAAKLEAVGRYVVLHVPIDRGIL
jgi:hypothetical protein